MRVQSTVKPIRLYKRHHHAFYVTYSVVTRVVSNKLLILAVTYAFLDLSSTITDLSQRLVYLHHLALSMIHKY